MTIITLTNGKKVGNFSSPHPFTFEDGSVLPAVSPEEAERLKVDFIETDMSEYEAHKSGDIQLDFRINLEVRREMDKWYKLSRENKVDVVFCPLPMIQAIKYQYSMTYLVLSPFRAIRLEDRIKKLASITKQCI